MAFFVYKKSHAVEHRPTIVLSEEVVPRWYH